MGLMGGGCQSQCVLVLIDGLAVQQLSKNELDLRERCTRCFFKCGMGGVLKAGRLGSDWLGWLSGSSMAFPMRYGRVLDGRALRFGFYLTAQEWDSGQGVDGVSNAV